MIFSKLHLLTNCQRYILLGVLLITTSFNIATGEELLPPSAWQTKIELQVTPAHDEAFGNGGTKISLKDLLIRDRNVRKRIDGKITREEKAVKINFFYGFSEQWLLSATIPFLHRKQTSSLSITDSDNTSIDLDLEEMIEQTKENLQSEEQQGMGDIFFQAAYVFTYNNSSFFRGGGGMKLPTGTAGTPHGILPVAIGDRQTDLTGFLHYTFLPPTHGLLHSIRGEVTLQLVGTRKTMTGEEGNYYGGNLFNFRYTTSYESNNWFYGGGLQLLLGTGSTIKEEEQNDSSFLAKLKADIGYGNLSDLEKSALSFPYQIRIGLESPFQGRNTPNALSWKLTSLFYF